jgi:hypothetical protein
MNSVGDLAHKGIAARIIEELRHQPHAILRLTGPPGSGKTWTATRVASLWEQEGGAVLYAEGDDATASRPLNPFLLAITDQSPRWGRLIRNSARGTIGLAEKVIGSPGAGGSLFDLLATAIDQKFERATRPLSGIEREILRDLRRLAKRQPVLLVADNAHWWDTGSIAFLTVLRSKALRESVPELARVNVLLVDTLEHQAAVDDHAYRRLIGSALQPHFELELVPRELFETALRTLGLSKSLDRDVLDVLFLATGAHLKLCEQLVALIEAGDPDEVRALLHADILGATLSARLEALGKDGVEVSGLLSAASLLGLQFNLRHLACLLSLPLGQVIRMLHNAAAVELVQLNSDSAAFAHDLLRTHFLKYGTDEERGQRLLRLAECLKLLKPGEYEFRARLLIDAGEPDYGRELAALGAVQRIRDGAPSTQVEAELGSLFAGDGELLQFAREIAQLYQLLAQGKYKEALNLAIVPCPTETELMAAERAYLAALCWLEQQTNEGFSESRSILRDWRAKLREEPELWIRFGLLLQQALVLSGDFDAARALERELHIELSKRTGFDSDATTILQIQNRRAAGVNSAEIAEIRIQKAVAYFYMRDQRNQIRHPIELYKALTNHTAILIMLGRDEAAVTAAVQAEQLIMENPETSFPRKDVLAHNLTLAAFRAGRSDIDESIARQQQVVVSVDGVSDNFIQRCSLASLKLLADDVEGALALTAILEKEIETEAIAESYLLYYASTLREAIAVRQGDWSAAANSIEVTESILAEVHWISAPYVRKRHHLMRTLIAERPSNLGFGRELDLALFARAPREVGVCWSHFGRLVLMSDLAFWCDS